MDLPPLPRHDLAAIGRLRDAIAIEGFFAREELVLDAALFRKVLKGIFTAMPKSIPRSLIRQSLEVLRGQKVTAELVRDWSWRLAGNLDLLRAHQPVRIWQGQSHREWMPLEVIAGRPGRSAKNALGHWFDFLVLAGPLCPAVVTRFFSAGQCRFLARELGFVSPQKRERAQEGLLYHDPRELVRLKLYGLFEPHPKNPQEPYFTQVRISESLQRSNKEILAARAQKPCPVAGYSWDCYLCTLGLDRCGLAVHPRTYVAGDCPICNRAGVPFDPAKPGECVDCSNRFATRSAR